MYQKLNVVVCVFIYTYVEDWWGVKLVVLD